MAPPPAAVSEALTAPLHGIDQTQDQLAALSLDRKVNAISRTVEYSETLGRFNPRKASAPVEAKAVIQQVLDSNAANKKYEFENLLPSFPDIKWDPLEEIEYTDVALKADPSYKNLWEYVEEVEHLTPKFGSVLYGIDLSSLSDKAREELARFIAFRGVVFVREQVNFDIKAQLSLGRSWGSLHRHATTGVPKGAAEDPDLLDVHVVYSGTDRVPSLAYSQAIMWHSDVSYEKQPPSYTSLKLLDGPQHGGGDTLWSSGYGLYDSLSPALQEYLSKLTALHSAVEQANGARKAGNALRREPVISEHPLVRTHPVTGFKTVYANPGFTRKIVGVPQSESDAILKLLFSELSTNVTNTVRWKWQKGDVALWDNRSTTHTASYGFFPHQRHAVRVTTTAERPYYAPNSKSQLETLDAELGIKSLHKDAANPPVYND